MVSGKILQKAALFVFMGSLNIAVASIDWELEGTEDIVPMQRGFSEEEFEVPEEEGFSTEPEEVSTAPKRRNGIKSIHKGLPMVPVQNRIRGGIVDDTGRTGVNADTRLPRSVKPHEDDSPLIHNIHQVIPSYLPTDFGEAE